MAGALRVNRSEVWYHVTARKANAGWTSEIAIAIGDATWALYVERTRCGLALKQLGEFSGGLDYRTVIWKVARFTRLLANDKQIRKGLEHVQKHLQNPKT